MASELILPSEIPWSEIKGKDLEELLYWLFDSMGAKNLEWRIGGQGGGAADQGRDLELSFFTPSPDGTLAKQAWWVDAKGRSGTVEPSEVHETVLNVSGKKHVDVVVIATNTQFSNPTRDWVKEWQANHPRPVVKLWEKTELENLCSKNPLAVIRLHKEALSPQGRVEVVSAKLWDYATFSDGPALRSIWEKRDKISVDERSLFALVASELANGNIASRNWTSVASNEVLVANLCNGLVNFLYLAFRANDHGARQDPLIGAITYLVQISLLRVGKDTTTALLTNAWESVDGRDYPQEVRNIILEPVLGTLQAELEDVCVSDCSRVMADAQVLSDKEVESYWDRFGPGGEGDGEPKRHLRLESYDRPCKVGFDVGKEQSCPLCAMERPHESIDEFMEVVERVTKFRMSEKNDV
nr:restriction endonuclease [Oceanococcus sp. HetDA_MAG_MS8]